MPLLLDCAAEEIELCPPGDAVESASAGLLHGALGKAPDLGGQAEVHLVIGQFEGCVEQVGLCDFAGRAVDAVHAGTGFFGVDEQQGCVLLGLAHLDGAIGGDDAIFRVVFGGDAEEFPMSDIEGTVGGEDVGQVRQQAAGRKRRTRDPGGRGRFRRRARGCERAGESKPI